MEEEELACLEKPTEAGEDPDASAKETPRQRRLRYATIVGIIIGSTIGPQNDGMAATWPNVFASDVEMGGYTSYNTSLPVSDWELDFMSSMYFIGTLPVIIVSGMLVSRFGRRQCMIICSVPGALGWMFVGLAPNVATILTGRFLCGAAHGLQGIGTRSYLAEIASPRIRGAAGVTTETMKGLGCMLIIGLGIFLPWYYVAIISACHFLFFGIVVLVCLFESPSHLVVNGREEEAVRVLKILRGPYVDHNQMITSLKAKNTRSDGSTGWRVLFKPDVLKRYLIVAGLFFFANFSGVEVVKGNATRMLQASGLAFDKDISTMIVFALLLCGNLTQTLVLDWIGRKKCLVISLLLLLTAYTILGTYTFLDTPGAQIRDKWSWIPIGMLVTVAFGSSLGIGSIPWLLSTEYFPTTIRPQVLAVCSITANVLSITALQLYSPLQNLLTMAGLYWFYAAFSALGIIYSCVFVYETKGINIG